VVNDLFMESLALQRIELMARLVASSDCSDDDKEVAISWLSELTSELVNRLNQYGVGQDECKH
ncbi:hypothetical protein ACET3U_28825, partial [Klebsiella pneumoniae]